MAVIEPAIVILAGGKSSRMDGLDKSQLVYQDQTFLERLGKEFDVFSYKYISDNQKRKHHLSSYKNIIDEYDEIGPLGGIVSVFHQTDHDYLFIAGCDMPFLNKDILYKLLDHIDDHDGICISIDGHIHPLGAIYSRKMLPVFEKAIENRKYSLSSCLKQCDVFILSVDDQKQYDNINTIKDYERIKKYANKN